MTVNRTIFFTLLLIAGIVLAVALSSEQAQTPLGRTLTPLFALFGKATKTADRILSRVLPIDEIDEKTLGEAFKVRMAGSSLKALPDADYVNQLSRQIAARSDTSFEYRAFIHNGPPNACALPGGVVLITTGLLGILTSEAQLVSVIGHEVGHIERGHCFDSVRFELLSRKLGGKSLGKIADILYAVATRHSFSKTQEIEADDYGYETLLALDYDPREMSQAFVRLQQNLNSPRRFTMPNPFRDYFTSHSPLELRIENYRERAHRWRERHPERSVYVGVRNYEEKKPRSLIFYPEESRSELKRIGCMLRARAKITSHFAD